METQLSFEMWERNGCLDEAGPGGDWDNEKIIAHAKEAMELWVRETLQRKCEPGQHLVIKVQLFHTTEDK